MKSLIYGIEFCLKHIRDECYYWESPMDNNESRMVARLHIRNNINVISSINYSLRWTQVVYDECLSKTPSSSSIATISHSSVDDVNNSGADTVSIEANIDLRIKVANGATTAVESATVTACVPVLTALGSIQYPYLVVNMGSGVSIVAVRGEGEYQRISGSR